MTISILAIAALCLWATGVAVVLALVPQHHHWRRRPLSAIPKAAAPQDAEETSSHRQEDAEKEEADDVAETIGASAVASVEGRPLAADYHRNLVKPRNRAEVLHLEEAVVENEWANDHLAIH